ncbi:MAG: Universal stress protein [Nocardioides sp.]|nr:Universal stress protein [Nocardioides sp.]
MAVGPSGSQAALLLGARLAVRTGAPLHLLHVVELAPGAVPPLRPPHGPPGPSGAQVLHRAGVRARELVRDAVPVSGELAHGQIVDRVLAGVASAAYLVVEQSDQPAWAPSGGEVCAQLADQVAVAVFSVPRLPAPVDPPAPFATISVGVKDPLTNGALISEARSLAQSVRGRLRVVHVAERSEHAEARDLLETTVHRLDGLEVSSAPTVETSIEVTEGLPVSVLRETSSDSAALVLGRHHRHRAGGGTLGPVARSLVHRSGCPVLLPSPSRSASSGEWVFQTEWA